MAHAGIVFLNQWRRLAGFNVRQEIVHQRTQAHRHHARFDVGKQQCVPVGGGVAHKIEHHALAHYAHRPEQEQRPFAHKAKTHDVQGKHHQRHDDRPLRQIADDNHHFNAVQRCTEDKLLRHMAVEDRHQREQHDRVDHKKTRRSWCCRNWKCSAQSSLQRRCAKSGESRLPCRRCYRAG